MKKILLLFIIMFSFTIFAESVDLVKKEDIKKENIKKEDIKKEDIKKENIKKEDIKKEDIKKEDIKKEKFSQIYKTDVACEAVTNEIKDDGIMAKGIFWAFLMVFIGGFLTSLTPCAFPVILISMPSLMKKEGSKKYKFSVSFTYVLGIATMYSSLGVFAALGGGAIGALMQNIWVISGFILFFVIMGLSSLGAFILQMPSGMTTKMSGAGEGKGYFKAYLSGLFLGILAAPCVGPVLAGVLAYIAQTGNVFLGFTLLSTFAFGMGVLIMIIGTFSPNWKSGAWMEKVNTIFGILLFLAALYFLKDIAPIVLSPLNSLYAIVGYSTLIFVLISLVIITVGYFIGPFKFEEMFMIEPIEKIRKLLGSIFMAVGLFMLIGVFLFLHKQSKFEWIEPTLKPNKIGSVAKDDKCFTKLGLSCSIIEKAKKEKKGIMIDFSGQGCAACAELKHNTFSNQDVATYINENFVPVYLHYTDSDEDEVIYTPMDNKFKVNFQWPTVIFIDKCGRVRTDLTLKGYEGAKKYLKRIKKVQ